MDNASGNGNAGLTFTASPAIVSGRGVGTKGSGRTMVSAARIKRRPAALPGFVELDFRHMPIAQRVRQV